MGVVSGRALALTVLAWSLVKMTVQRLFGEKTGLALFHENYDADRLPPVDADERAKLAGFSRCIACGLCDVGEAPRIAASKGKYPGLMSIVLASSRSMPDFDAAKIALDVIPDEVLAEKEAICPTGVPFVELATFVRAKAASSRALAIAGDSERR
jgi:succinate dehydrogenase/fumarate reductase-like Fe-S protein